MRNKTRLVLVGLTALFILGCATTKGAIMGAGVGYIFGDATLGAQIGATAGLVKDIWN